MNEPSNEEVAQWAAEKRYQRALRAHPDPRDPDYPAEMIEARRESMADSLIKTGACDAGDFSDLIFEFAGDSLFREWLEENHQGNNRFFTTKDPAELMKLRDSLRAFMADRLVEGL